MSTQSGLTKQVSPEIKRAPSMNVVASAKSGENDEHAQRHAKLLMRMMEEIGLKSAVKLSQVRIEPGEDSEIEEDLELESDPEPENCILIYQKRDTQQENHCYMKITDTLQSLCYHVIFTNHEYMPAEEVYKTFCRRMKNENPLWIPRN